jgi:hypothetical protein
MYMLIPEIYSNHASHLYNVDCGSTFGHIKCVATITKRIIISNYSSNKICDEQMIDIL